MTARTRTPDRAARWRAAALAALAMTAAGPAAAPAQQRPAAKLVPPVAVQRNVWPDEQFERWAFGQTTNAAGARRRFDELLAVQIDEIDRTCHLSDVQKTKLRLMGMGDVKRVFEAYEKAKQQFNLLGNDIQQLQDVAPLVRPVMEAAQAGPFQAGSLFAKSLRHVLTDEQFARYDAVVRERRAFRHRAQIKLVLDTVERGAPLRDAQRAQLTELLTKETKPPRTPGQYDFYLLMQQVIRLSDDKVKPLLTAAQWKAWGRMTDQYKPVVQNLRQAGIAVDQDDADPPEAGK